MKRKILESLVEWKTSEERKPLLLNGARQVGKTYILEEFGKAHFENVIYLNMEIEGNVRNFIEKELAPRKIIQFIESTTRQEIIPEKTLIFFDGDSSKRKNFNCIEIFLRTNARILYCVRRFFAWCGCKSRKILFPCG